MCGTLWGAMEQLKKNVCFQSAFYLFLFKSVQYDFRMFQNRLNRAVADPFHMSYYLLCILVISILNSI